MPAKISIVRRMYLNKPGLNFNRFIYTSIAEKMNGRTAIS
jgi:hypothetical protein